MDKYTDSTEQFAAFGKFTGVIIAQVVSALWTGFLVKTLWN